MASHLIILCLVASFLDATATDICLELSTSDLCAKAGQCIWEEVDNETSNCVTDPCYEKLYSAADNCNADAGVSAGEEKCEKVTGNTLLRYCVTKGRAALFTGSNVCKLEFGDSEITEKVKCKTITGCGPVEQVAGVTGTHYVCTPGSVPRDPCTGLNSEGDCKYVKECMWESGACVTDECWERTLPTVGKCRDNCGQGGNTTNPYTAAGVTGGWCKTGNHELANVCNVESTTWSLHPILCTGTPDVCNKEVKISNFDGSTLYVCNDEDKELKAEYPDAAVSLKSFAVALLSLVLLVAML